MSNLVTPLCARFGPGRSERPRYPPFNIINAAERLRGITSREACPGSSEGRARLGSSS